MLSNRSITNNIKVGIAYWSDSDGIASALSSTLEAIGVKRTNFLIDSTIPPDQDILITYGPMGSLVPLVENLQGCLPSKRPCLIFWQTEQLPNPNIPSKILSTLSVMRSIAERFLYHESIKNSSLHGRTFRVLTNKAHRFRYFGDLIWMQELEEKFVLVLSSKWISDYLRQLGFDPLHANFGPHHSWGTDLGIQRDIPVLWIGNPGSRRRRKLLDRVRSELSIHNIEILMVDGVNNEYVFGKKRTELLNRSMVVLNLLREKWDDNSMRYYLAAINKALIISEPTLPHTPFEPGKHMVISPSDRLSETIRYYINHDKARQEIVENAFQMVENGLTMKTAICQIIKHIYCSEYLHTKGGS